MSECQATLLHLFIITEDCHNQGLQVIAGLPCHSKTALPCHSKTAGASLPGKSAGQVCRRCPINGCSQKKVHTDFKSDHVKWPNMDFQNKSDRD
jgi:hypothetical protein